MRAAGDLLSRAGFTLQVADGERLSIGYGDPLRLLRDLRGMAAGNLLPSRKPVSRSWLDMFFGLFNEAAGPDRRGDVAGADHAGSTASRAAPGVTGWRSPP